MGNPLKDQLLKAGLASKKQARKVEHEKRLQRKRPPESPPAQSGNLVQAERVAQEQRNRELNRQRAEEQRLREGQAQIRQLIESNRLDKDERGEPYHFSEQNQIKRIFVSEEMTERLSRGQLAIVKLGSVYEVVPAKVAGQIAERDPGAILAWHRKNSGE
ncbi:MAG TPA: DUF2058 domain-containing protein [Desulfurivibrio alkaliphilus]|uniref:DUF2058 domain-containing protein n=1 Tax=Desulfurivibrio alkaliphilus TaxID=427923 RepID=A0A7C2XNF7_9BACT|nr:DUF2058 domain-containing protein [Desulfurivibrio alkaliphilus]